MLHYVWRDENELGLTLNNISNLLKSGKRLSSVLTLIWLYLGVRRDFHCDDCGWRGDFEQNERIKSAHPTTSSSSLFFYPSLGSLFVCFGI